MPVNDVYAGNIPWVRSRYAEETVLAASVRDHGEGELPTLCANSEDDSFPARKHVRPNVIELAGVEVDGGDRLWLTSAGVAAPKAF